MTDPTFERRLIDGAWLYADPDAHSAALWWAMWGFSLAALDDHLAADGWDTPAAKDNLRRLLEQRAQALQAFIAGDEPTERRIVDRLLIWLQFAQREAALLPLAVTGKGHRAAQAHRASKPRGLRLDDGTRVKDAVEKMALAPEHRALSAKTLWPRVFAVLDDLVLDPAEVDNPRDPARPWIEYTDPNTDERRTLRFATFQDWLTDWRSNKKSD